MVRAMDASRAAALVATLALALAVPRESARAQTPPTTVVIVGVSDVTTGQALEGAEVFFPGFARGARADAMGEARITIPSGTHRIRVRFLGYAAADTSLTFTGDTSGVVFQLERTVLTMDAVEVKAPGPTRLKDFEYRRRIGIGKYLTVDELQKEGTRPFGIVAMTRFPGLRLVHDGDGRPHIASVRGSCGVGNSPSEMIRAGARSGGSGGRGAGTTGGSPSGGPGTGGSSGSSPNGAPTVDLGSCTGKPCHLVVYLDDIQLDEADFDIVTTWDLAGVEYYTGNNMPARYRVSGSACGVLLLWSR